MPRSTTRSAAVLLTLACAAAAGAPLAGRSLGDVLAELQARGLRLVYNNEVVPPGLRVEHEPATGSDVEILRAVLAPHGLRAVEVAPGTFAISPDPAARPPPAATVASGTAAPAPLRPLEEIVVAASRYRLADAGYDGSTFITQSQLESLPRLAEDSLRAVHRLPGAASNGLSGLAHIRGGEENETQIVLDGLALYEPFHLKNLLSPVSVLDARMLGSLDVHAGGFTAEFGDRMSAIVDARSVRHDADRHYELGLSLFHANALAARRFAAGRGQWLVSARRSNLEEIADLAKSDLGEPAYLDAFARLDYAFSDRTRGAVQTLVARDEADVRYPERHEASDASDRNSYVWATLEHDFSARATGRLLASFTDVDHRRAGTVAEPGEREGYVDDRRDYDVAGLRADGQWSATRLLLRYGAELRWLDAHYHYRSEVRFGAGFPWPDSPPVEIRRELAPAPAGEHYAAYVTARLQPLPALTAEIGLRWDEQTYAGLDSDGQFAPRLNLAWDLPDGATRLRAAWGRFQQFQGIHELQVEDGVDEFQPTQSADHAIVGVEHGFDAATTLRVEAYRKSYQRPRFRFENLFDPVSLVPELQADRVRIDPATARAEGIEFMLTRTHGDWSGWGSYTWSRVEDRVQGADVPRSWDQPQHVGAGLTWESGPWRVTGALGYHTGWPTTPVALATQPGDGAPPIEVGPRNAARLPYFATLDLRASRSFALRRGSLEVFAELTNALDRSNRCCVDYDYAAGPDGGYTLEREYRDWLPLVPSVGVLWSD